MMREPSTAEEYIDMAQKTLVDFTDAFPPAVADGLLRLAHIWSQLATAKAVMELKATLSQWLDEYMIH